MKILRSLTSVPTHDPVAELNDIEDAIAATSRELETVEEAVEAMPTTFYGGAPDETAATLIDRTRRSYEESVAYYDGQIEELTIHLNNYTKVRDSMRAALDVLASAKQ